MWADMSYNKYKSNSQTLSNEEEYDNEDVIYEDMIGDNYESEQADISLQYCN